MWTLKPQKLVKSNEVAQQAWRGKNIDIFFRGAKEIKAAIYLVPLELNI
jgi:hypothetical protein